jgi:hypothetical protein
VRLLMLSQLFRSLSRKRVGIKSSAANRLASISTQLMAFEESALRHATRETLIYVLLSALMKKVVAKFVRYGESLAIDVMSRVDRDHDPAIFPNYRTRDLVVAR